VKARLKPRIIELAPWPVIAVAGYLLYREHILMVFCVFLVVLFAGLFGVIRLAGRSPALDLFMRWLVGAPVFCCLTALAGWLFWIAVTALSNIGGRLPCLLLSVFFALQAFAIWHILLFRHRPPRHRRRRGGNEGLERGPRNPPESSGPSLVPAGIRPPVLSGSARRAIPKPHQDFNAGGNIREIIGPPDDETR
jgi:hypothetical protein